MKGDYSAAKPVTLKIEQPGFGAAVEEEQT